MADKEELLSGINFISQETLDGISETDDSKLYLMEKTVLDNGDTLDFRVQYPLELDVTTNPNVVNAVYNNTDCLGNYSYNNRTNSRSVSFPYRVTIKQGSFSDDDIATWELSSYIDIPFNYKTDVFYTYSSTLNASLGYMDNNNKFIPLFFFVEGSNNSDGDIVHISSPTRVSSTTMAVEDLGSNSNYGTTFYSSTFRYFQFYTDGDSIYARSENRASNNHGVKYRILSSTALADLEKVTTIRIAGIQSYANTPAQTEQGVFRWPYDRIICETEWQTPEGLGLTRVYPPKFTSATVLSCGQDYNNLENLPTLNNVTIRGNITLDNLDVQKSITAKTPLSKSLLEVESTAGLPINGNIASSGGKVRGNSATVMAGVHKVDNLSVVPAVNVVILPYSPGQVVTGGNYGYTNYYFGELLDNGNFVPIVNITGPYTSGSSPYTMYAAEVTAVGTDASDATNGVVCNVTSRTISFSGRAASNVGSAAQLIANTDTSLRLRYASNNTYYNSTHTMTNSDGLHGLNRINAVLLVQTLNDFTDWDLSKVGVYSISGVLGVDFGYEQVFSYEKTRAIDTTNTIQYLDVKIDNQTIQINANGELSANLDEIGSDIVDINSALGGFAFKSMTQTEYAALATKDPTTLYVTTGSTPGLYFGSVVIVQGAA